MEASEAYKAIAQKLNYKDNPHFIRLLQHLMTPDEARLAVELPAPKEDLAQKLNMDVADVGKLVDDMFVKGLIFPKDFQTREGARFARSMTQLHDATQANLNMDETANRELFALWEAFCKEGGLDRDHALGYVRRKEETPEARPRSRVVPAYQAIKDNPDMIPEDDIREILRAANGIALVSCSCRKRAKAVGRECEKSHDANCFLLGRGAQYALARGSGRLLTYEEALEIIDQIEEDGLVHSWTNSSSLVGGTLCSCCCDCCVEWDRLLRHDVPISLRWEKSRYVAEIEDELCNGCQICVDRCQFNAIEMVKPEGSRRYKAELDQEKCFGCGVCYVQCAPEAVTLKAIRPPEFIPAAV